MSSGAFALYVDQQAGGGNNAPIYRIVPLPRISHDGGIHFDQRRLTLIYDDLPPASLPSLNVTGRFLGGATAPINVTVVAGECHLVDIPTNACAASLFVNSPTPGKVRGPLTALVEYNS